MKRWRQQGFEFRSRGGRRSGAGRRNVPHRARPTHKKAHPVHVTLRAARDLPNLREQTLFGEIRRAFGCTARSWFRVVHFSVQADHVHLLVEADDKGSLSQKLRGMTIRLTRAVNRTLRRNGRV